MFLSPCRADGRIDIVFCFVLPPMLALRPPSVIVHAPTAVKRNDLSSTKECLEPGRGKAYGNTLYYSTGITIQETKMDTSATHWFHRSKTHELNMLPGQRLPGQRKRNEEQINLQLPLA